MKLVRGPSKSMLQWLCLFGNINQFSFYILGSRTKVFRCTLEEWFSFSSSFFTFFAWKLVSISYFIDACYRKRCLATRCLMVRRYYVILENSKELFVA